MILLAVCGRGEGRYIDYLSISEIVWPDPEKMPDDWADILKSHVSAMRGLLRAIGSELWIETKWGWGLVLRRTETAQNDNNEARKRQFATV
ncbi:hypothetical protein TMES_09870 [Thalassospira mesophila]|uniref:OmpR/PhoB-type domain-containing protein n=2 Tax=Thalassospira mesophila TaxID=1293891 RepID=A0A1Y2L202_9PROT|nr:hypothetical protein TMES_09870 [Thalassospira mesophila]